MYVHAGGAGNNDARPGVLSRATRVVFKVLWCAEAQRKREEQLTRCPRECHAEPTCRWKFFRKS